ACLYFARFILRTSVSGSDLPSTVRPVERQVKWSASTLVIVLVAESFCPSGRVATTLAVQVLGAPLLQIAWAKPPVESKVQETMLLFAASQPIHCVPPAIGTPLLVLAKDATRKFWFSAQVKEISACSAFLASSTHSPTSQVIGCKNCAWVEGVATASRTL